MPIQFTFEKNFPFREREAELAKLWDDLQAFHADASREGPAYSIVIPPPNATAKLHVGHALNNVLQDIVIRLRRMQGNNTLWIPGEDHAAIATHTLVERQLREEGQDRFTLGREPFEKRVFDFAWENKKYIRHQLERIGCSCDWTRERYTLDETCSQSVFAAFKQLYDEGLIYKGKRIVNWDPAARTAISDDEVVMVERQGHLWHLRYPLEDGSGYLVVATTRPETMLGDTAVAVNPNDPRYGHLVGKRVALPIVNRSIPIVADESVEMEFGTGCVKVTPAHDKADWETSIRHRLPVIVILDESANICQCRQPKIDGHDWLPESELGRIPDELVGLDRDKSRQWVVDWFKAHDLLEKITPYQHVVGVSYRDSNTIIEPYLSDQWWVNMKSLAEPAVRAVKEGHVRFIPERWTGVYLNWMENIQPWCISRQIWFGHPIPIWENPETGEVIVSREDPGRPGFVKCPDVLDTWFSSWLWPISTMGWPEETEDLTRYYPTGVLITASEIIFFWVARMIMAGYHFRGEKPFSHVYIHGTVRDETGRKMSKSLGNGIDPLDVVDELGCDAMRFTLAHLCAQGQDLFLSMKSFEVGRNFVNKIYNATKLVTNGIEAPLDPSILLDRSRLRLEDRWILSQLGKTVREAADCMKEYRFSDMANGLYDFFWKSYCDWYLESIKPRIYGTDPAEAETARTVSLVVLEQSLRALHPIIPFVTEDLWGKLRPAFARGFEADCLATAAYPTGEAAWDDPQAEADFASLQEWIAAIRNLRAEIGLQPNQTADLLARCSGADLQLLVDQTPLLKLLAKLNDVTAGPDVAHPESFKGAVVGAVELMLPVPEVDREVERERLTKELSDVERYLGVTLAKLANETFTAKAPAAVVAKEKEKATDLEAKVQTLRTALERLK